MPNTKHQNFYSRSVDVNQRLLAALHDLQSLNAEFQALNYGATLEEPEPDSDVAYLTRQHIYNLMVAQANLQTQFMPSYGAFLYALVR